MMSKYILIPGASAIRGNQKKSDALSDRHMLAKATIPFSRHLCPKRLIKLHFIIDRIENHQQLYF